MRRRRSRKSAKKAKKKTKAAVVRTYRPSEAADEVFEDRLLAADARRALADSTNRERISWEQLKAELGL